MHERAPPIRVFDAIRVLKPGKIEVQHSDGCKHSDAAAWIATANPGPARLPFTAVTVSPSRAVSSDIPATEGTSSRFASLFDAITANMAQVVHGKMEPIELAVMCMLAEGHLLIEDVPGVGKTSLAKALAA